MNIVQTLWLKNSLDNLRAGWLDNKFHLYSWGLSFTRLKKYYDNIELNTDSLGAEILTDWLKLDYKVNIIFDEFDEPLSNEIWVLNKLYSYSKIKKSFIHVDGDVFLYNILPILGGKQLLAQNLELNMPQYYYALNSLTEADIKFPNFLRNLHELTVLESLNAGVIGSIDNGLFANFYEIIRGFIKSNYSNLSKIKDFSDINLFIEQLLIYEYAKFEGFDFKFAIDNLVTEDSGYKESTDFTSVPYYNSYIHLSKYTKINPVVCELLSQRLLHEDENLYHRINKCLSAKIEAKQYSFIKQQEIKSQDPFFRTKIILGNIYPNNKGMSCDFANLVNTNQIDNEIVRDIYIFEKTRKSFLNNANFDNLQFLQSLKDLTEHSDLSYLDSLEVIINTGVCYCESKWRWKEDSELGGAKFEVNMLDNLKLPESYFEVVFLLCNSSGIVQEFELDPINIIIFENASEKIVVKHLIEKVTNEIREIITDFPDMIELSHLIRRRILFYLYLLILKIL